MDPRADTLPVSPESCSWRTSRTRFCVLLGVWLLVGGGCWQTDASTPKSAEPDPTTVEWLAVTPELLIEQVELVGQFEAAGSVVVRPETEGLIDQFVFREGQAVKKGAVLFVLRNAEQKARLRAARAELALEEDEFQRTQKLATQNVASSAQLHRAEAELEVARAEVELAQVALERTYVRAPFDGLLGEGRVWIGDRVDEETGLVRLDDIERLQLFVTLPENAVPLARTGVAVTVGVAAYPGEEFSGEVFFVSPTLDPETRRLLVKAWVANPGLKLRPGMFANARAELGRREDALLVPEAAVVADRVGRFVWRVDEENRAERAPVELGIRQAGRVEVVHGLRPGDRVITAGTHKIAAGDPVQTPPAHAAERKPSPPDAGGGES